MPNGHYTGETANVPLHFPKRPGKHRCGIDQVPFRALDFQKWIRTTIGDEELAHKIDQLDKRLPEETLQQHLTDIVQKRISELQLIETSPSRSAKTWEP